MERSLNNYIAFVTDVLLKHVAPCRVTLLGAVLPTLLDNTDKRFLKGERAAVTATLRQRKNLTKLYNKYLLAIAGRLGTNYVGITRHIQDDTTKLIDERLKNDDPFDHHLSPQKTSQFWISELGGIT